MSPLLFFSLIRKSCFFSPALTCSLLFTCDTALMIWSEMFFMNAMFVFWNLFFGKLFSKLFCVRLPLGKLVNRKHFPVNEKHFPVNGNTFRSTKNTFQSTEILSGQRKNLVWFPGKCFPVLAVFVFWKVVSGKPLSKLSCVCLPLEKLVNGKHFPVKGKIGLVFRKVFSWKI